MIEPSGPVPPPTLSNGPRLKAWARAVLFLCGYFVVSNLLAMIILIPLMFQLENPLDILKNHWALLGVAALAGVAVFIQSVLFSRYLDRKPLAAIGMPGPRPGSFLLGFGLGVALQGLLFLTLLAGDWISVSGWAVNDRTWLYLSLLFILIFFQAGGEEVLCRGYLLHVLGENGRRLGPVLITSLLFAAMHLGNPNLTWVAPVVMLNIALTGVSFCLLVYLQGNLSGAIGLHIAWNFCLGSVFSLPVSGTRLPGLLQVEVKTAGVNLFLTGGEFGPEGSLLLTGLLALVTGALGGLLYLQKGTHMN